MASATDTRPCTHTRNWEYGQTGTTPSNIQTVTETKDVGYTQWWYRYGGIWEINGSPQFPSSVDGMSYVSGTFSVVAVAPTPSHSAPDGTNYSTPGLGRADYRGSKELGKQPIYGWMEISSSHTHPSSVTHSSGNTLSFNGCTASAGSKTGSGNIGDTSSTVGAGTASYSGSWTDPTPEPEPNQRPNNWNWSTLSSSVHFSSTYLNGGLRKANLVSATDWNNFCSRINDFRVYKKLSTITFTSVSSQQSFTNTIYQQAVTAISAMGVSVNQSGGYYTKLVNLRAALNSIS